MVSQYQKEGLHCITVFAYSDAHIDRASSPQRANWFAPQQKHDLGRREGGMHRVPHETARLEAHELQFLYDCQESTATGHHHSWHDRKGLCCMLGEACRLRRQADMSPRTASSLSLKTHRVAHL